MTRDATPAITLTVDGAGRVVLPSATRRRLNLGPGSKLRLAVVAERIELTPEAPAEPALILAASRRRVLPPSGGVSDAAAAVRDERAARAQGRAGR